MIQPVKRGLFSSSGIRGFAARRAGLGASWALGMSALVGTLTVLGGCGILSAGGSARMQSSETGAILSTDLPTRIYTNQDNDTADIYMTDLPHTVWDGGADVSDMAGVMIHIHMFLRPQAGHTPIADTASTAIVRCVILAKGEIGVYGGGGFFVNEGDPGDKTFTGGVRNGTMCLVSKTAGFQDKLGPCTFAGAISGTKDAKVADQMERAMRALIGETKAAE